MNKKAKLRSLLLGGVFTLLFVALVGRLYWVQVVQGAGLLSEAQLRWEEEEVLEPVRGSVVDRNNKVLAEDAPAFTIALVPETIKKKNLENQVVKGLAAIIKTSDDPAELAALEEKIRTRLNATRKNGTPYPQVEIHNEGWKIDAEVAEQVRAFAEELKKLTGLQNVGIILQRDQKRFYPNNDMAAHVLGFSNKEGKPVMGLETKFNSYLSGTPGKLSYEKDRYGVQLPGGKVNYQPAVDGNSVKLTIDKNIQYYIESALEKVNEKYHPKSLTAIAVDPKTMEILGLASMPNFNPNRYWETKSQADFINNGVASQYEPGSTFKLVTLAAAVEEGVFNPNARYQSGSIQVPGRRLHDWKTSGWGQISYLDGLKRSSNVAFVKLGYETLGQEKLKEYIDKFGFGAKTGIDLPGEVAGMIPMRYPSEFATATYGQGLTVTAIQQTAAYAAIANGGKLMWPHVVKEIYDSKTKQVIESFEPKAVRQVVSESTARQVSEYLEQVVSDKEIGTGKNAYIDGYRVAGKTGTANKVDPGGKGYAEGKWVISFIGFAPVEDPRILVTVIADEPDLGGDWHEGSNVAAPAFKEIVSQALRYMGVPYSSQQTEAAAAETVPTMPDLTGHTVEQAKSTMSKYGLTVETVGKGSEVVSQTPAPGTQIGSAERIYVVLQEGGDLAIPNLTGKSLRDALEVCSFMKLKCQSVGEGYVASQSVSGTGEDRQLTLELKPYNEFIQSPPSAASTGTGSTAEKNTPSAASAESDNTTEQNTEKQPADQQETEKDIPSE
ncbi:peptidoglycan D,D-transpeptidase FtsI family protein [Paenibacillus xerothermodurans]|uniref:PASTA domain-containing protein n=1 Tax=Paenibacillus xerothermodurans TaxID=1977292 RepID=A0A2W1P6H2_PAEXE|nr:penicillin-binding protein 2 [Paenibacillus xerothermodurans]PZE22658.1 PASTA domain-containing protein [Paenibacillus xerothermodurans]